MSNILIWIGTILATGLFVLFISKKRYFPGAICAIIGGVLLSYMGFVIYFCREPSVGINSRGLLFVSDGSIFILSGILFSFLGVYILFFRKQILKKDARIEAEIKKQSLKYPTKRFRKNKIRKISKQSNNY